MEEVVTLPTEKLIINLSRPGDAIILDYLTPFERTLWEDKTREALKIGIVAIKAASPVLDAKIVEEKFKDAQREMDNLLKDFKSELNNNLKDYFDREKGHVNRTFTDIFGPNGQLHSRLERAIGPGSEFAKKIDPAHKESVVSSIEKVVQDLLVERLTALSKEFSLDAEGSAISRLRKTLEEKIDEIKQTVTKLEVKKEEAEKGTQKGRTFQEDVYAVIECLSRKYEDIPYYCADTSGLIPRCKTGDVLCEISNSDGNKIIIEAKKEMGYTLNKALEELRQAKENRGAQIGVFVFAKGYEPKELGSFRIHDLDTVCVYDEEEQDIESSLLRAAYTVARANAIKLKKSKEVGADLSSILRHVHTLANELEKFNSIKSGLDNARRAIENVDKATENLKAEIKKTLDLIDFELKKGTSAKSI